MTIITIDCGGTIFKTTESTLRKSDFFNAMLDRWNTEDVIFLDEDDKYFRVILIYLRNNVIEKNTLDYELLMIKFKYYIPYAFNNDHIDDIVVIDSLMIMNNNITLLTNNCAYEMPLNLQKVVHSNSGYYVESSIDGEEDCSSNTKLKNVLFSENNTENYKAYRLTNILPCINARKILIMEYLTNIIVIVDIEIGQETIASNFKITRTDQHYQINTIQTGYKTCQNMVHKKFD